jgi:hypothetical protein
MRWAWSSALILAGCSSVTALDAPRRPLAAPEVARVEEQSKKAEGEKDYATAWNHEFFAGARRERLEAIFLAALRADAGPAEDMMAQLRKAHGGLTPEAQREVKKIADEEERKGDWERAAEVHVVAAADAPKYEAAWDVYTRAPSKDALAVFETIQGAREAHEEAATKRGP